MSLKSFHVVFIAASISLMGFLAAWSGKQSAAGLMAVSILGLAASLGYLAWFLRHYRALR